MNQDVLTLTPGGRPLAQSLGYEVASVVVDNYTSSYVTLTDAGKTIPPWVYGAVVAMPPGLRRAVATLTPTVPAIPGPPVPVSQASLTWLDLLLPADPGHLLQQSAFGSQVVLGSPLAPANGSSGTLNFAVPAGTQSIGYLVRSDGGNDTPTGLTILGHQSKNAYTQSRPLTNVGGVQWYPFSVSDTSVDVTLNASVPSPAQIDLLASPLVEALDVGQAFGTVPTAELVNSGGSPLQIDSPAVGVRLLGVSQASANPAAWEAAQLFKSGTVTGLASGSITTLIPGVANQRLYLHYVQIDHDNAAALLALLTDRGNSDAEIGEGRVPGGVGRVFGPGSFGGAPVPTVGGGLGLKNSAGPASDDFFWTITYSLGT